MICQWNKADTTVSVLRSDLKKFCMFLLMLLPLCHCHASMLGLACWRWETCGLEPSYPNLPNQQPAHPQPQEWAQPRSQMHEQYTYCYTVQDFVLAIIVMQHLGATEGWPNREKAELLFLETCLQFHFEASQHRSLLLLLVIPQCWAVWKANQSQS